MKSFRTYSIAVEFYRLAVTIKLPRNLKDQLSRAASSVVLNLAEGSGRNSKADQNRIFHIAFGSLRECRAILELAKETDEETLECADKLAAHLYKLIHSGA